VEQVVRLIRSKCVGVYFCSQFPDDVPENILGQLGHRVQHALRAFTPRDQKAVNTAAQTFVANPKLDVAKVISQLGVGEALVSMLADKGVPMPVERTLICAPHCRMGAITDAERATIRSRSPVGGKYDTAMNRESAAEMLAQRHDNPAPAAPGNVHGGGAPSASAPASGGGVGQTIKDWMFGTNRRQGIVESMAKQTARTIGSQVGRQILRGVLGGIMGSGRR
jgi:DNA helicase HerA-like ATPase